MEEPIIPTEDGGTPRSKSEPTTLQEGSNGSHVKRVVRGQNIVAIILTLGFSSTIIILALQEASHGGHLTGEETTLISTVLGAVVGAIATYLGTNRDTPGV